MQKKVTTRAISSGLPNRPSGICFAIPSPICWICSAVTPNFSAECNGVLTGPGLTAFTLILRGSSSADSVLASVTTAAFVAEYTEALAMPTCALIDVLSTIELFSGMSGNTC